MFTAPAPRAEPTKAGNLPGVKTGAAVVCVRTGIRRDDWVWINHTEVLHVRPAHLDDGTELQLVTFKGGEVIELPAGHLTAGCYLFASAVVSAMPTTSVAVNSASVAPAASSATSRGAVTRPTAAERSNLAAVTRATVPFWRKISNVFIGRQRVTAAPFSQSQTEARNP